MITKYKTDWFDECEIKTVEVIRETEQSVFINRRGRERREAKVSEYHRYFDTWAQARDYLREKWLRRLDLAREDMRHAETTLGEVERLVEPAQERDAGNVAALAACDGGETE